MSETILATKLFIPPPPRGVVRQRLLERLDDGLGHKLTLISAPAGFGKTTLLSEWVSGCECPVAWLSLDTGDSDPTRFLSYVVAAVQTIAPHAGTAVMGLLRSPQPAPVQSLLTALLNDIAAVPDDIVLVLDDYHVIDAGEVDAALTFLLDHLPPRMHVVIATREDPHLPLARLRARGQLTELRATDLRFTPAEATEFLTQVMELSLSPDDIAALETRTEGWIAGLQLAAISMRGLDDAAGFIASFTGSHRFVLDYLVEEVLHQQSERVQAFLLRTAILDRLCGSLCDAVLLDASPMGQDTLEYLEHANLFIVPLDNERRWYRYHHLFAELLRQRLGQSAASSPGNEVADLHIRASAWLEDNGLEIEAFQHATAANDVKRAERLIDGNGMPLHFRGAVAPVLSWLESLSTSVLDDWPSLWTTYASVLLATGRIVGIEQKLQAADAALQRVKLDDRTRDLIGRNAAVWASYAATLKQVDAIIAHSRRAMEYLHPDNLAFRTSTTWKLGYAYQLQGDRAAAGRTYADVIASSQASGNTVFTIMAAIGLGSLQESANQLHEALETFLRVLQMLDDRPLSVAGDVRLGFARIYYEWNDLETANQYGQASLRLAQQTEQRDRVVACDLFLARLKRARGDLTGAAALVAQAAQTALQHDIVSQMPDVVSAQARLLLDEDNPAEAARLAETHDLPLVQARLCLARGDAPAALAALAPFRQRMEATGWERERLQTMILQALACQADDDTASALRVLDEALSLAEPGGLVRSFVDEGEPMERLLTAAAGRGTRPEYVGKLLAAFNHQLPGGRLTAQPLIDPLSQRELEVLRLVAQGLSNREISDRLYLALDTVKGHNRAIFSKLQVQRRTEAVARARELRLL
jgi:LuxR family transcriptional regulator, maltose regulon positive regulatory protein